MKKDFNIINPSIISETLTHNMEMIKQFMELYKTQIPIDFNSLKTAIQQENQKEIASITHHIKPTMNYIGADALKSKLEEIEYLAKNNKGISAIHQQFDLLNNDYELLMDEIDRYLQTLN